MKNKFIFLLALLLAASTLFSQTDGNNTVLSADTNKIKIRAKRDVKDPLNTSLATTIITSDELKANGANNLADALKDSVGLQIQSQGGSSILNIRGSRTEQVVVLINGVRLNNAQGMGVDLNAYGVQNVERIEVIRGSATTRYGANASGGVINIITKDRVDNVDGIETRVHYGSFENMGVSALASKSFGKDNQGSIFISGTLNTSKGNYFHKFKDSDVRMGNNKSVKGQARAGLSYKLNDKDIINFDISALKDDKQIPSSITSFFTGNYGDAFQDVENYGANLSYENNSFSLFNFGVQANVLSKSKDYRGSSSAFGPRSHDIYNNIDSGISANLDRVDKFGDAFTFKNTILLEYKNNYFYTLNPRPTEFSGNVNAVSRNTVSIGYLPELGFMNFENTDISRLTLFPAIRFDAIIGSGAVENKSYYVPSYSLGAMYTIDKEKRYNIKANFNSGYRLPGFDDLYVNGAYSKGNVDLKRETSLGGDLGFIITPHDIIRLEALYYVSEYKDLITWLVNDAGASHPINIDKVLLQGVEANLLLQIPIKPILSKVELNLNYLYQFGKIVDGAYVNYSTFPAEIVKVRNNKLARTPDNSFNVMLAYVFEGNDTIAGRLNFYTHYLGKRYNAIDNKVEIPETLTFDLTAALTVLDTITIEGGVKNIADVRYENVIGYPQAGREWFTAISAKF